MSVSDDQGGGECAGAAANCQRLRENAEFHAERCAEAGLISGPALTSATAVGLVIYLWRNSPVEDMHAKPRGPSDAVMFAESTALHDRAIEALTAPNRADALLDFEEHLLDRTRPWAGASGKTLNDFGYGSLTAYRKHVKARTDVLISISKHTCVREPLQVLLVGTALLSGRDHKGMPMWPTIVDRIRILLDDPAHPAWRDPDRGQEALAAQPPEAAPLDELAATLLIKPYTLPIAVLEWLSEHLLHCAGPPYTLYWRREKG